MMAGLPRLGRLDCLSEPGIVHQAVAWHLARAACLHGATAWWYETGERVSNRPKRGKPAMRTHQPCN